LPKAAGELALPAKHQILLHPEPLKTINQILDLLLAAAPVNT
jgi:hypothetical protein